MLFKFRISQFYPYRCLGLWYSRIRHLEIDAKSCRCIRHGWKRKFRRIPGLSAFYLPLFRRKVGASRFLHSPEMEVRVCLPIKEWCWPPSVSWALPSFSWSNRIGGEIPLDWAGWWSLSHHNSDLSYPVFAGCFSHPFLGSGDGQTSATQRPL